MREDLRLIREQLKEKAEKEATDLYRMARSEEIEYYTKFMLKRSFSQPS